MITKTEIETAMRTAAGNPDSGILADYIPTLAAAVDELVNPKAKTETRVIKADEVR
jgi:glutaminase